MSAIQPEPQAGRNHRKWLLFAVLAVLTLLAVVADEKFLIDPTDREWAHIAPFRWWLLPHGLAGVTALVLGPIQFSERLRRRYKGLHRVLGRVYIGAICIAAPLSIYIANHWNPPPLAVESWAQGGGWLLCALMALAFAMKRNIVLHRQWVARSYAFTFIFVAGRAPDFFHWKWNSDADFATFLWFLVFAALTLPDLMIQSTDLLRRRKAPAAR
jgi:uncharacterized membrane protein